MDKPHNFEKIYKVYIEKTYQNEEGFVFMKPDFAPWKSEKKHFVLIYFFKKIPGTHNPMMVVEAVLGDDFKGRSKMIKEFEKIHSLEYSVQCDLNGRKFGEI